MVIDIILLTTAFISLLTGTYTDIKTREVPDWINYSLIIAGLGIRLLYSIITNNWNFTLYGLYGFGIFLALGYLMFYTGQWGGGDSKMLMGLGALIGFRFSINDLFLIFVINALVIGAIYGLIYSIVLAVKNRKKFSEEIKKLFDKIRKIRRISMIGVVVLLLMSFFLIKDLFLKISFISLIAVIYISLYLWIFVKAVENSSMLKLVNPDELTAGDWVAKNYFYKGKKVIGPKDLGIEKHQIELLKKIHKGKILIKQGIPFVPSFLISFIISLLFGAWWILII